MIESAPCSPFPKIVLLAATTALIAGPAAGAESDFQACLQNIRTEAIAPGRAGRRSPTRAFRGLTPDQKVIDLDARQPDSR